MEFQVLEMKETVWNKQDLPPSGGGPGQRTSNKLYRHESMDPGLVGCPQKLADVVFLIISESSWPQREIPTNLKKADVSIVFEKGKKENPESYRLFSFNLIPGNRMDLIILETNEGFQTNEGQEGSSLHRLMT